MQVEICCNSILSARHAHRGGATRIELCQALDEGGTTPSAAAIRYCVNQLHLETRVLIRPRGGNFCYDDDETDVMLDDIAVARECGAHAIVVGFLTPQGDIDTARTRMAVEAADGREVTFHRAFDECHNPQEALEQIIACGCHKLLTSGCRPTAWEGRSTLKALLKQAAGRIAIIGAAGVTTQNVASLLHETGLREVHGSLKHTIDGLTCTDEEQVRDFMKIVKNIGTI